MSWLFSLVAFIFFFVELTCFIFVVVLQYSIPALIVYTVFRWLTKPFRYSD